MMALIVGLIDDPARRRQARLRRRPAVEGGAGRIHERPGRSRSSSASSPSSAGSPPMPTTSSTSCGRSSAASTSGTRPPLAVGLVTLAVLLVLPRVTRKIPAVLVAVVGATVVTALFDLDVADRRGAARGPAPTDVALDRRRRRRRRCWSPPLGITLVSLTDTIATSTELRRPPGRRGRPEPGDGRHRRRQHRRRPVPGLRRVDERFPHGRGRAIGRQEPADRAGRCRARRAAAARRLPVVARRPSRSRPSLPSSSPPRSRWPTSERSFAFWRVRKSSLLLSLVATAGVIFFGVLEGILTAVALFDPAVLPAQLVAPRRAAGRGSSDGWHSLRSRNADGGPELGGDRVPVGGPAVLRQRGHVPATDPPPRPRVRSRVGSCSSAKRSPTSTSPRPRCSNGSTSS